MALERPGGGVAHGAVRVGRPLGRVLEQRRLAHPGAGLEHDDRAVTAGEAVDGGGEHVQFDGTFDERLVDRGGRRMLGTNDVEVANRGRCARQ